MQDMLLFQFELFLQHLYPFLKLQPLILADILFWIHLSFHLFQMFILKLQFILQPCIFQQQLRILSLENEDLLLILKCFLSPVLQIIGVVPLNTSLQVVRSDPGSAGVGRFLDGCGWDLFFVYLHVGLRIVGTHRLRFPFEAVFEIKILRTFEEFFVFMYTHRFFGGFYLGQIAQVLYMTDIFHFVFELIDLHRHLKLLFRFIQYLYSQHIDYSK